MSVGPWLAGPLAKAVLSQVHQLSLTAFWKALALADTRKLPLTLPAAQVTAPFADNLRQEPRYSDTGGFG
jgi:hypothetical protein